MSTPAVYRSGKVVEPLVNNLALRRATYFVSPTLVVKATRHNKSNKRTRHESFILSFGVPNYTERNFIKLCKKAGEKFPVKKVQLKFWPKKRK